MPSAVVEFETGVERAAVNVRARPAAHSLTRRIVIFAVKLIITGAVLAVLFSKVKPASVIETMRLVPLPALLLALGLACLQPLIAATRWHLILRRLCGSFSMLRTFHIYWNGIFAAALLPGGVSGDGLRMWILSRAGLRPSKAVNSVLLDRAMALTGLFLLVAITLPFLDDAIADAPVRYASSLLLIVSVMLGYLIGLSTRFPLPWHRFRAIRAVMHLSSDLRAVSVPIWRAAGLISLSALVLFCYSLKIFLLIRSLQVPVSFFDALILSPLVILSVMLPISIGGWGLREASMMGLFAVVGVPATVSLSVSVLSGLLTMLVTLPGALIRLR
jgi:glycosyltransferase 2 family protein